ncbi:MAG: ATP-binding protein [Lachnospiraceae bacterium]|nr:ATP-binding protein [Lachnospiraceae bacterium]
MAKAQHLILYKHVPNEDILQDIVALYEKYKSGAHRAATEEDTALAFDAAGRILDLSGSHGFYGNLWHCYLAYILTGHENVYSIPCEIRGGRPGSMNDAALHDFRLFQEFFHYDMAALFDELGAPELKYLLSFEGNGLKSKVFNARIRDYICQTAEKMAMAESAEQLKEITTAFYRKYGVGKFGLHKAFRITPDEDGIHARIVPILNIAHVQLDDLVGYELPKQKLIDNTEAFISGRRANNCLLFGDAGTGKSSSIKGILNAYYEDGLRIIEVYKHQFGLLHDVIAQIKDRNYKFILYMDDLSFEEFETEYKYLKAIIEGGLENKPDNVLIYATSNRRHLIKESFADKEGRRDALHASDTVQEKLSLVNRFGVTIFFGSPDKKEFQNIVKVLAERNGIDMPEEELLLEANKWELAHGGLSGRTAQQFIDSL